MKQIIVHDADGLILRVVTCGDAAVAANANGQAYIEYDGPVVAEAQYVNNGVLAAASDMALSVSASTITADGVDECVISNVPANAAFQIAGPEITTGVCTDGSIEFSTTAAGTYHIIIEKGGYISELLVVEAI